MPSKIVSTLLEILDCLMDTSGWFQGRILVSTLLEILALGPAVMDEIGPL